MTTLFDVLLRWRWATALTALSLAVISGALATGIRLDNSLSVWFLANDPALASYQRMQQQFGTDEVVVTVVVGPRPVLEVDALARLQRTTAALQNVAGLERVLSLANVRVLTDDGGGMRAAPVLESTIDAAAVARARHAIAHSDLANRLVTGDGRGFVVYAFLRPDREIDSQRSAILDAVRRAYALEFTGPVWQVHHGGIGVIYDAISRAAIHDGGLFMGLSYLVIIAVLFAVTRRFFWVAVAVAVVTLTDLALFAAMVLLDRQLNAVTVSVPALVLVLGVADVLHFASHLEALTAQQRQHRATLVATLAEVAKPCLFNSATTLGGLLALTTASAPVTRDFGLFAGLGVALAFVFTVLVLTCVAPWLARLGARPAANQALAHITSRLVLAAYRRPLSMLVAAALFAVAAAVGITRVDVDTYSLGFLSARHPAVLDSAAIEAELGRYMPLEVLLHPTMHTDWRSADFIKRLRGAQQALEDVPFFGRTLSIVDVLGDLAAGLSDHDRAWAQQWHPANDAEVAQIVEVTGLSAADTNHLLHRATGTVRLTATVHMGTAREWVAAVDRAHHAVTAAMGDLASVEVSGYLPLYGRIIAGVVRDQVQSFGLAFAMIFGLIALVMRSWRLTLAALVPNVLPVAMVLGLMGFVHIRLDTATVIIAATVLGIVVDDTVHTLYQLRRELQRGAELQAAVVGVAERSGVANLSTAVIVAGGFFTMALASIKSVALIGLLSGFAVLVALACDVLVLPPLLRLLYGNRALPLAPSPGAAGEHRGP